MAAPTAPVDQSNLKPFFKRLGADLRKRRLRRDLTQEDMIGRGFSARHWQQIEAGRPITLRTLLKACAVFGVLPSSVLRNAEQALPSPSDAPPGLGKDG